jgi:hypothetical protein
MKILSHGKQLSSQALKERFLRCFGVRVNNAALLQDLVKDLIGEGVSRQTLVAWAVEAGYSRASVRSTLSRIFVSLGLRERERGAGRKPSPAALELAAHARRLYGKSFVNMLRAAWRVGKAQLAAENHGTAPDGDAAGIIEAPQSVTVRANAGDLQNRRGRSSIAINFKRTFKPLDVVSNRRRSTV